ncbi:MAG: DUF2786 domain-containing protein [bacterium]|nr:DUF2786 domain-containing protein [bacterium]
MEIGLNKALVYQAKDQVLKNILRHELAHLLAYLASGATAKEHGLEFRQTCRDLGWGPEIFKARADIDLENLKTNGDSDCEKVIEKVKKLLALSASPNIHESQLATIKANEILVRYNLEKNSLLPPQDEFGGDLYLKRVLGAKRVNAKLTAISRILRTFLVDTVFNHGTEEVYLEIIGSISNVEIAEYVANFLNVEFENLWKAHKENYPELRGLRSKNSFFRGIAQGYQSKVDFSRQGLQKSQETGLVCLEKQLEYQVKRIYGRLNHSSSLGGTCERSKNLGNKAGQSLSIKRALNSGNQENSRTLCLPIDS